MCSFCPGSRLKGWVTRPAAAPCVALAAWLLLGLSVEARAKQAAAQAAGEDTCLMLAADNIAGGWGNHYLYVRFAELPVTLAEGDVLEYDIFLLPDQPELKGGVDIWFHGDRPALRDTMWRGRPLADHQGIRAHGDGVLAPAAGKWYRRTIPLDAAAGRTTREWCLASEGDARGSYVQFVDNVAVCRRDGSRVAVYSGGAPPAAEPALAGDGYSKLFTLLSVDRALVDRTGAASPSSLRAMLDALRARGERARAAADLRGAFEVIAALRNSDEGTPPLHGAAAPHNDPAGLLAELDGAVEDAARFESLRIAADAALADFYPAVKDHTCHYVGHAHIDYQWLWEWPQTIEVCRETFGQALRFMEEFPDFTFTQSSAGLYAAAEEHLPALFQDIRRRVREGRWEIAGGRLCEGDEHMASPESHARHFLYGQRYFRERFGRTATVGWEPDTFGHTAQMPQILRLGGCDSVYFCRGGDNVPLFWWEAPDSSRVLAFEESATGSWYNGGIGREQLKELAELKQRTGSRDALCVYGVGNHGGGPTREHLETAAQMQAAAHAPAVRFSTARAFFDAVIAQVDPDALPVLRKELNSRRHSGFFGTYTTHGDVKRLNRDAEAAVEAAEALAVAASFHGFSYPHEAFREIFEDIAWNHHHDTICGTAIHPAYERSRVVYAEAIARSHAIGRAALEWIACRLPAGPPHAIGAIPNPGEVQRVAVFNTLCWARDALVEIDLLKRPAPGAALVAVAPDGSAEPVQVNEGAAGLKGLFAARALPSMGYRIYDLQQRQASTAAAEQRLHAGETFIENGRIRADIDPESGAIVALVNKEMRRDVLSPGGRVELRVFFEKPGSMSAWVIGELMPECEAVRLQSHAIVETGPARAAIRSEGIFRSSRIVRYLSLSADSPSVEARFEIDWQERGSSEQPTPFLKLAADTAIAEARAFFEVPFAVVERPCDGEEAPALRWAALEGAGAGLALLNDCRYGYSADGAILALSLLRAPNWPDPVSDVGRHAISCALLPYSGIWQERGIARRAAELNQPVQVCTVPANSRGELPPELSYFVIEPEAVTVTGIKAAEDRNGVIVRCYEGFGQAAQLSLSAFRPIETAEFANFIEDRLAAAAVDAGRVEETLPAWRIATLKLRFR